MLLALEVIVCFTPLGSLPVIGPIGSTLGHVPVIAAALLLGTQAGTGMGFFFGLFRFISMTIAPSSPVAFVFTPFYSVGTIHGNLWSIAVCFIPRILVGTVTGVCFTGLTKLLDGKKSVLAYGISGFVGSMTNTILVLGGIYLFFGRDYAAVLGKSYELLIAVIGMTVLTNGVPEAIIGAVVAAAVCRPIRRYVRKRPV